jgi:hypothetical protein
MYSYIVHSGWWCDGTGVHPGATKKSDPRIRSQVFFDVWYEFVTRFTKPEKIIVVDSASPTRPQLEGKSLEFLSMKRNFLHGMTCDTKYGGWTRAFFTGAFYALMNDAEYAVFIEQDCLPVGDGIIESAIAHMGDKQITFSIGGPNHSDQSLTILRADYILKFAQAFFALPYDDREMDTETKFMNVIKEHDSFIELPFGYGRNRPINFKDNMFAAQQWRPDELAQLFYKTDSPALRELLNYENSLSLKLGKLVRRATGS